MGMLKYCLVFGVFVGLAAWVAHQPVDGAAAMRAQPPTVAERAPNGHQSGMRLWLDTSAVMTSEVFTVHVAYANVGMPHTTLNITPTELVAFEAGDDELCAFPQHNNCQYYVLRAVNPGTATLDGWTMGEAYHDGAWVWTSATAEPIRLSIYDPSLTRYYLALPLVSRAP
jgi:hypothetical protein